MLRPICPQTPSSPSRKLLVFSVSSSCFHSARAYARASSPPLLSFPNDSTGRSVLHSLLQHVLDIILHQYLESCPFLFHGCMNSCLRCAGRWFHWCPANACLCCFLPFAVTTKLQCLSLCRCHLQICHVQSKLLEVELGRGGQRGCVFVPG